MTQKENKKRMNTSMQNKRNSVKSITGKKPKIADENTIMLKL